MRERAMVCEMTMTKRVIGLEFTMKKSVRVGVHHEKKRWGES